MMTEKEMKPGLHMDMHLYSTKVSEESQQFACTHLCTRILENCIQIRCWQQRFGFLLNK
jgi:hypothetical protein